MALTAEEKTAVGKALGAPAKVEKERRTVRVDLDTLAVYGPAGGPVRRIGTVTHYVRNERARTPSGGRYTSARLTVRISGDDRRWVGQLRKEEIQSNKPRKTVTLRPLEG